VKILLLKRLVRVRFLVVIGFPLKFLMIHLIRKTSNYSFRISLGGAEILNVMHYTTKEIVLLIVIAFGVEFVEERPLIVSIMMILIVLPLQMMIIAN